MMWTPAKLSVISIAALLPCSDRSHPTASVPAPPFEICTTGGVKALPTGTAQAAQAHQNHQVTPTEPLGK
jgi:hypothetical protein